MTRRAPAKPMLLLDIDDVLLLSARPDTPERGDWQDVIVDAQHAWINPALTPLILDLAGHADLVWCTGWEHQANAMISPLLGLPQLPVIDMPAVWSGRRAYKLPAIQQATEGRGFVLIDDDITPDLEAWAAGRDQLSALVRVDPRTGLRASQLEHVRALLT